MCVVRIDNYEIIDQILAKFSISAEYFYSQRAHAQVLLLQCLHNSSSASPWVWSAMFLTKDVQASSSWLAGCGKRFFQVRTDCTVNILGTSPYDLRFFKFAIFVPLASNGLICSNFCLLSLWSCCVQSQDMERLQNGWATGGYMYLYLII